MDNGIPPPAPPELDFEEFQRIYGRVEALSPSEAAELFRGAPFRWWVAGGWSTELESVPRRFHEDLEIAVPHHDVPALREWLSDYHLWGTRPNGITYLVPGEPAPSEVEQLWLRRDAYSPWLMDLMLTPVEGDMWFYKRDHRVTRPLHEVIRVGSDGIPRQSPEVTLLYKARRRWARDEADFAAVVPGLSATDRQWLRDAIALTEPARHPWLDRLR